MRPLFVSSLTLLAAAGLGAAEGDGARDPATIETFRPYQLDTCLVSDEAIGSMGEGRSFVHDGQEITVCCKGCIKKFAKQPAHFVDKLQKLEAAASEAAGAGAPGHDGHDQGDHKQKGHDGHDHGDHKQKGHDHSGHDH